jgi:hypothetical protein
MRFSSICLHDTDLDPAAFGQIDRAQRAKRALLECCRNYDHKFGFRSDKNLTTT